MQRTIIFQILHLDHRYENSLEKLTWSWCFDKRRHKRKLPRYLGL